MKTTQSASLTPQTQPSINPARLFALVVILGFLGLVLVRNFGQKEEQREMLHWQNKIGIIADSRAADVSAWLAGQFRELATVANNPSLQLYVTTLQTAKTAPAAAMLADDPAQAVYLRNLLLLTADRLGFLSKTADPLKSIHANVHPASGTGLAIVDNDGKILVSTEGLPVLDAAIAEKVKQAPRGTASLIDMFPSASGETQIGFVLPVYAIQGDPVASQQIGKLVGIKTVGDDFYKLLLQPGVTESTFESILLRKDGSDVVYLSGTKDDKPLSQRFALSTPSLDAAYAVEHPASFAILQDRLSRRVLMTSRVIKDSPWVLLLHVGRDEALAESDAWLSSMEWIMLLVLLTFVLTIIAAWWYGTSKRATLLSVQTGKLAAHLQAQETLLRLVTDNQPEPIFIADAGQVVHFANDRAGKFFGVAAQDAVGKDLSALLGKAAAAGYAEGNQSALSSAKVFTRTHAEDSAGGARILRSEHIPLAHIPIDGLAYPSPGVLVVDQDVTEIVNEKERRERILRELIRTLVHMVDERDPFAANHSSSVALVARNIATSMGLDPSTAETAEIAGSLMNIGKIVVPSDVLTKTSALDSEEVKSIRDSLSHSAQLLEKIEFDGPVVETLRQSPEHYDGTGPLGLKGDAILITARIIAVANAFVGMISPRSYRAAISIEQAAKLLGDRIDKQFDRRVVAALFNFVENKHGRELLSGLAMKKVG